MIPFSENEEVCNRKSGVYAIVNIKIGKFYIGSAVKLSDRKSKHLNDLRKGKHHSKYLQNSYDKYGVNYFVFKILKYVEDKKDLLNVEQEYLDIYFHTGVTYNMCGNAGSWFGRKHSTETKKKISDSKKKKSIIQLTKNNVFVARFNSITNAEKQTGIGASHISACCSGKCKSIGGYLWMVEDDYLSGKKYEKNHYINVNSKSVLQFTKNNVFVARFVSMIDAKKQTGIHNNNISECCLGKLKSAGGYLWMYETDYLNGRRCDENNLIHRQSKPVLQFTKNNEFVKKYNSITDAEQQTESTNISACCLGKQKSASGYIWRFEN